MTITCPPKHFITHTISICVALIVITFAYTTLWCSVTYYSYVWTKGSTITVCSSLCTQRQCHCEDQQDTHITGCENCLLYSFILVILYKSDFYTASLLWIPCVSIRRHLYPHKLDIKPGVLFSPWSTPSQVEAKKRYKNQ